MDWNPIITMVSLTVYKLSSLAVGLALCYWGYKLFMSGVWGPKQGEFISAGEINAQFGDNRLLIKRAAPGTFFVVLGAVVLIFTICKGLGLGYEAHAPVEKTEIKNMIDQGQCSDRPNIETMPQSAPIK
jgi:hypothetical protein